MAFRQRYGDNGRPPNPWISPSVMKEHLSELIARALESLVTAGELPEGIEPRIQLDRTRDPAHGDTDTNPVTALSVTVAVLLPPFRVKTRGTASRAPPATGRPRLSKFVLLPVRVTLLSSVT